MTFLTRTRRVDVERAKEAVPTPEIIERTLQQVQSALHRASFIKGSDT